MNSSEKNFESFDKNESINLYELLLIILRGKFIILSVTMIFGISAVIYSLSLPNKYASEVLLIPYQENDSTQALMSRYGGIANMAGISLPEQNANKSDVALEILKSRKFVSNFIKQRKILIPLMASKGWDQENNKLIIEPEIYDIEDQNWTRKVSPPFNPKPSDQEAYKFWTENVISVSKNIDNGFVTISVEHFSPENSKIWIDWLVEDLNTFIRNEDVDEANLAIEFFNNEIKKNTSDELRNLFYSLIQSHTETLSMAYSRSEYIFKTVDPAYVPELKSSPNRAMICIVISLFGFISSIFLVLFRHHISSLKNQSI